LESKAKAGLNPQLAARGLSIQSVSCPSDLDPKVGASETCTATGTNGANLRISATVTSVSGSNYTADFKVLSPAAPSSPTPSTTTT
jgi:hypothetical protein